MVGRRWAALLAIAALAAGAAGCGSGGDDSGTDVSKIAFVHPGADNEPDWTAQAQAVVEEFPESLGVRVDVADASQADDVGAVLEQVSGEGNQLVIAHDSRWAQDAERVAEKTDVPELVWGERDDAPEGLIGEITVQDKEGGYLAGMTAAGAAVTERLGVVVAADGSDWDLATWNRMAGGFVAGARAVAPRVEVRHVQVGSDGDATADEVYAATKRLIRTGSQMIFVLGGGAAAGGMRALIEYGGRDETLYIGVVGDKEDAPKEPGNVPYVLASVVWDTRPVFRRAVRDVRAGTFGERPYALTLADRGVWLHTTGRTPGDAYEAAMRAQERIEAGKLDIPVTSTGEAVDELIADGSAPQG